MSNYEREGQEDKNGVIDKSTIFKGNHFINHNLLFKLTCLCKVQRRDGRAMVSTFGHDISEIGRLVGNNSGDVIQCYSTSTFIEAGWDFVYEIENGTEGICWILEGQDYPRLWWELIPEN